MNPPAPHGLPAIAAYLRDLAMNSPYHTQAGRFRDMAMQIDRADRELRHLGGLSARIRDIPSPEDLKFLADTHDHWQRAQAEIDAESASGA